MTSLSTILDAFNARCLALGLELTQHRIYVSIGEQKLYLFNGEQVLKSYAVSTSSKAPSCTEDSLGTPWGLHRIAEKIGDGAPLGGVFRGRRLTGAHYKNEPENEQAKNLITSRILWLAGLEPELNQGPGRDSFERYIYIHGTNHEDRIGTPASGGCVQLKNTDMVDLFDHTPADTLVWIDAGEK